MVETQARSTGTAASWKRNSAARVVNRPSSDNPAAFGYRRAHAAVSDRSVAEMTKVLILPGTSDRTARLAVRKKAKQSLQRRLRLTGEAAVIATMVASFAIVCAMGIIYFAAFAAVAAQGREIHSIQVNLSAAQARHENLVQQLTQLNSASRISELATRDGMVLGGQAQYVTVQPGSPALAATQMASAR